MAQKMTPATARTFASYYQDQIGSPTPAQRAAHGANGSPSALSSSQYPNNTQTAPAARARAPNSPDSRDLPTPASPPDEHR
jgi:hypothetical protein